MERWERWTKERWKQRPGKSKPGTLQPTILSPQFSQPSSSTDPGPQINATVPSISTLSLRLRRAKSITPQLVSHYSPTVHSSSSTLARPQIAATVPSTVKFKHTITRACRTTKDVGFTALQVLHQSSDAFPPLKSAVGSVLGLWQTAKSIKSLKEDAQLFSEHVLRLESSLRDVVDPTALPTHLKVTLNAITSLLLECEQQLVKDAKRSYFGLITSHNRNKDIWTTFNARFSRECEKFTLQVTALTAARVEQLRVELQQHNAILHCEMIDVKSRLVLIHEETIHFKTAGVCFF